MASTLKSPAVAAVLDRLHATAQAEDGPAGLRVRAREEQLGERLPQAERYKLYGEAPLAIKREVGELLYVLAASRQTSRIVEFGASHGISTIYLAAALRDYGGESLITTEQHPRKVEFARVSLIEAGLEDVVELRAGDALETLADLPDAVDLLFLDGRNDLYLPVLRLVEPRLSAGALVAADLSAQDPDLLPYLEHVRDPAHGYFSICVPLDDGIELSVRLSAASGERRRG